MNCAEQLSEPTIFFNLYTIQHSIQVPKVYGSMRFKSNWEFRYQILVSSIKFRKAFGKFTIRIALFKKFPS